MTGTIPDACDSCDGYTFERPGVSTGHLIGIGVAYDFVLSVVVAYESGGSSRAIVDTSVSALSWVLGETGVDTAAGLV